ncbi:hypothetical protein THTE_1473 [Thermogutta terrifontis]|uniref:Uncharacterized protein n=1 Tax=Thermogutta terrifontis TaxID=1331910 RepID=A0A286RDN8_9BACT|nr:hypothetical protein THTE_1473 [Thermogutta terrifontis]
MSLTWATAGVAIARQAAQTINRVRVCWNRIVLVHLNVC